MGGALQKEVSHGFGVPLVDIFAERKEQVRSTASVQPKCRFLGSSMRLEPVAEGGNENGTGGRALGWLALADLVPDEVLMEKLHPGRRVIANPSSLEMRASAAAKMSTKGIKHVEYEITYDADSKDPESKKDGVKVSRGFNDEKDITDDSAKFSSKEYFLGTCSSGTCISDTGVTSIKTTVKITKTDGKVYQSNASIDL